MTNKNSVWCTIMGIIGYITGIAYCFTLILIPVAVYCFIGARKYIEWSSLTDGQLAQYKQKLTNWAVFFSIVGFPIGLLSIIPACMTSNNVTITNVEEPKEEGVKAEQPKEEKQEKEKKSPEDKIATIEKLENLKKEGLITEEEFERAKKDVLEN